MMIANISPSSLTYEDTLNTLKYADRAKKIKVDLKKNVMSVDFHIAQYAKIVEDLRGEIVTLKDKIRSLEQENASLNSSGHIPAFAPTVGAGVPVSEISLVVTLKAQLNSLRARQQDYDDLKVRKILKIFVAHYYASQKYLF